MVEAAYINDLILILNSTYICFSQVRFAKESSGMAYKEHPERSLKERKK